MKLTSITAGDRTMGRWAGPPALRSATLCLDRIVTAAAVELSHLGVTANVVNPGPTDTGWMPEELKGQIRAATPSGRLGQPTDAANVVGFLCSQQGAWINGQVIMSDGGLTR